MEILNPSSSIQNPQTLAFFNFPFRTSPFFPLHRSRVFTVSAQAHSPFHPPIKRRKSHLRKKLIQQQVRLNPNPTTTHLQNPLPQTQLHDNSADTSISPQNTALWTHLETWANQYKADAEFWGIGSNPVFTVFQDSNGKVEKVDVNEDEILRRGRIHPPLNLLENVKQKISHAKLLAKQKENAKQNLLPPNTSVAKFVSSSGTSGFRDTITSFTNNPAFLPRLSKAGMSVFCGFIVFMAFKSFSRKEEGDKQEHSSLDKEMLRRKMKARMAKEKSIKASVEVIQDDSEDPEMVFKGSPQLDKEELMNSIVKVKALDDDTCLDLDDKIQEIRAMARHTREIEKTNVDTTSDGEDDESINNEPDEKEVNHIEPPASFDVPQGDVSRVSSGLTSQPNINQSVVEDKRSDTERSLEKDSVGVKLKIIGSVREAREYLHRKKLDKKDKKQDPEVNDNSHEVPKKASSDDDMFDFSGNSSNDSRKETSLGENGNVLISNIDSKDEKEVCVKGSSDAKVEELRRENREKWMEDNFHELEPLVEKIRGGFRNNYKVAREKVREGVNLVSELKMPERDDNESEFEWMKDEKLKEIVFQVRENELMGRDPFYLMDTQDKALFFKGLEKKVEKQNEKLRDLHEYLHSNIENLDYGADGISLYDPPEKMIPRWKGPPPATTMSQEFLDDYLDQRKTLFAQTVGNSDLVKRDPLESSNGNVKNLGTVIEGSDGSIKPCKKSGKEFWQHTKKWSLGFIESYNAENDPDIKAAMKDIGKDLDRWITKKEIQDAADADIMDKVPDRGKKFIAEKINKLKREIELFGPQAVVSKYSEYGNEEEEIDYYWWLDLPFLLCIELYIDGDGDGDQRIGFYSLEMASDLELDPKPHHIIAFEDAGDCKNLCYIIQAHMEMLGNGNAFVVPQLPKDTYREAKANGFNVTVIRKGELKLDVDQTLEEVEEKLVEIGSKMYHDKIMKGRNVGIDSVMKGVFGLKKPLTKRRRWKKKLKKPTK